MSPVNVWLCTCLVWLVARETHALPLPMASPAGPSSVTITSATVDSTPPTLDGWSCTVAGSACGATISTGTTINWFVNATDDDSGVAGFIVRISLGTKEWMTQTSMVALCSCNAGVGLFYGRCSCGETGMEVTPFADGVVRQVNTAVGTQDPAATYTVSVAVFDVVGNMRVYASGDLIARGFPGSFVVGGSIAVDNTPPTLASVNFLPQPNLVWDKAQSVAQSLVYVGVNASDNAGGSKVLQLLYHFAQPLAYPNDYEIRGITSFVPPQDLANYNLGNLRGQGQGHDVPNGEYRLALRLVDNQRNEALYSAATLTAMGFPTALTVSGGVDDSIAPTCSNFSLWTNSADVSSTGTMLYVEAMCDDVTSHEAILLFLIQGPGPNAYQFRVRGISVPGTRTPTALFLPAHSLAGEYRVIGFRAYDELNNLAQYGACDAFTAAFYSAYPAAANYIPNYCDLADGGGSASSAAVRGPFVHFVLAAIAVVLTNGIAMLI